MFYDGATKAIQEWQEQGELFSIQEPICFWSFPGGWTLFFIFLCCFKANGKCYSWLWIDFAQICLQVDNMKIKRKRKIKLAKINPSKSVKKTQIWLEIKKKHTKMRVVTVDLGFKGKPKSKPQYHSRKHKNHISFKPKKSSELKGQFLS